MDFMRRLFRKQPDPQPEPSSVEEPQAEVETPLVKTNGSAVEPLKTRPLPPPEPYVNDERHIEYGQASDTGHVRNNNQDACLSLLFSAEVTGGLPPMGLFIVADGMGGHHDGELASAVAVRTIAELVLDGVVRPHIAGQERTSEQRTIPEVLTEALQEANQMVQAAVPNGGTTATCAVIRGDLAYFAHVGDSRAYLFSGDNTEVITRDHSLVQRLQELGQLTAEEAEIDPRRNMLYRALGQGESIEVDTATRRLPAGAKLLLCSDGLWGVIGDTRIREIVSQYDDPQEACNWLVAEANSGGGPDNISAVLAAMPD